MVMSAWRSRAAAITWANANGVRLAEAELKTEQAVQMNLSVD